MQVGDEKYMDSCWIYDVHYIRRRTKAEYFRCNEKKI